MSAMVGSRAIEAAGRHFFSDEKIFTRVSGDAPRPFEGVQRGKSGNERRHAYAIYHSLLSVRIELKKSSKFKEKLKSEQVVDLRSFFFFATFFFLCGEIEFLGKMGITLSRQKTTSDCSFESVVLCRFNKSTYIR